MTAIAASQPILAEPAAMPLVAATPITVTATLKDSSGAAWNSATVIIQLIPGFGHSTTEYTYNGAAFTTRQEFTTTSNTFSVSLPANNDIIPIDSSWQFIISGNPLTPAVILTQVFSSKVATTFDLSTAFTSAAPPLNTTGGGSVGLAPQIIKVADQPTAIASSSANPNNFYYWV